MAAKAQQHAPLTSTNVTTGNGGIISNRNRQQQRRPHRLHRLRLGGRQGGITVHVSLLRVLLLVAVACSMTLVVHLYASISLMHDNNQHRQATSSLAFVGSSRFPEQPHTYQQGQRGSYEYTGGAIENEQQKERGDASEGDNNVDSHNTTGMTGLSRRKINETSKQTNKKIDSSTNRQTTRSSFHNNKINDNTNIHNNNDDGMQNFSFPYWNLSCPVEMSTFSTAHIGGDGFLRTAYESLRVALPVAEEILHHWPLPATTEHNGSNSRYNQNHGRHHHHASPRSNVRRIFFVGDSLLRQVFIAISCLLWNTTATPTHATRTVNKTDTLNQTTTTLSTTTTVTITNEVTDFVVPWFERRPVRAKHPHTYFHGPHSKFEEARVWMTSTSNIETTTSVTITNNNSHTTSGGDDSTSGKTATKTTTEVIVTYTELIYDHDMGQLLQLGVDYENHDDSSWILNCQKLRPFSTLAVSPGSQQPHRIKSDGRKQNQIQHNDNKIEEEDDGSVNEKTVHREHLQLSPHDIVLVNGSVHKDRAVSLGRIAALARCLQKSKQPPTRGGGTTDSLWPHVFYVATGAAHFPTSSGVYDATLLNTNFSCTTTTSHQYSRLREEEWQLRGLVPILGSDVVTKLQYQNGNLHVGGNDCLHWSMPGIPDRMALSIVKALKEELSSEALSKVTSQAEANQTAEVTPA